MSIMGEPIPRPIEKIPGVKPPIGLETRPAPKSPPLSELATRVLKAMHELRTEVEATNLAAILKENVEDIDEVLGDLFTAAKVMRVGKKWSPLKVEEIDFARPTKRDTTPEKGGNPEVCSSLDREDGKAPAKPTQQRKSRTEPLPTPAPAAGVTTHGGGARQSGRAPVAKEEIVAENADYRLAAPVEVETKSIPTPKQAPKLDELVRRARDECDAKIAAARAQMEQAQELALREFNSRVEGITWALEQIGGAA